MPNLDDLRAAQTRIHGLVHRTPVLTCATLDRRCGGSLFFKCENFQRAGAFKFRGASNTVLSLSSEARRHGVVTHSSGNHAGGLALAAKLNATPAHIVMPENSSAVKVAAVRGYGAEITFCAPTQAARERTADRVVAETGGVLVHPYDDDRIICGQGTAALELLADVEDLDLVVTPIGGGGLLSGTAIAVKESRPQIGVIGAEPLAVDDACRSFRAGRIVPLASTDTIADGLRASLGVRTFPVIQRYVDDIVTVSEDDIINAMRLVWERMKIVIEPSSAVPLAAVLGAHLPVQGKRVGIIISGGNVDLARLPWT